MEDKLKELFASGEAKVIADGMAKQKVAEHTQQIIANMEEQLYGFVKNVVPEELLPYLSKGSESLDYGAKWYHWYLDIPECTQIQISLWAGFHRPVGDAMPAGFYNPEIDIRYSEYKLYNTNNFNITQGWSATFTLTDLDKVIYKAHEEYKHLQVIAVKAEKNKKEYEARAEERKAEYEREQQEIQAQREAKAEAERKEIEERNSNSDVYITTDEYGVTLVYFSERFWKQLKGGE